MSNPGRELYVRISESKEGLQMASDSISGYVGTQWDDNAQTIVFERSKKLEQLALLLIFHTSDGRFEHLLGVGNTYAIRNSLSKHPSFTLQIAFIDGGDYRYGTNKLEFRYRPAPRCEAVPASEENRFASLEDAAFAGVRQSGSTATFFNKAGQSVGTVTVGGGTPIRGVDYWTTEDIAAILSELQAYIDTKPGVSI